jgi:hypothetical protein
MTQLTRRHYFDKGLTDALRGVPLTGHWAYGHSWQVDEYRKGYAEGQVMNDARRADNHAERQGQRIDRRRKDATTQQVITQARDYLGFPERRKR